MELTEMIYCNHDHLEGDFTSYQDGNQVFGATFSASQSCFVLQSSKLRSTRSGSDLSVKTCSNNQLKIAVLNQQRRRFRA